MGLAGDTYRIPITTFFVALALRILVIPLSILELNPYSQGDVHGFSHAAELIAASWSFSTQYGTTYETWGVFLAPFWLLPGPSSIYAHLFVALLGAFAVYNVAVIAQTLHSPRAGLYTGLPLALYPSIVLTQSTLLREAAVLFGITTAARLLIAKPERLSWSWAWTVTFLSLAFATLQRPDNVVIYILAIVAGGIAYYWKSPATRLSTVTAGMFGSVLAVSVSNRLLQTFNTIRRNRARGRTEYLGEVRFDGLLELIVFSWIGAVYLLYTPFPWMIETLADVPVAFEALGNIVYTIAGVFGVRASLARDSPAVVGLAVFLILGVVLYGYGTVNYGTAVRHRSMFLWALFLFGGVGIAQHVRVRV